MYICEFDLIQYKDWKEFKSWLDAYWWRHALLLQFILIGCRDMWSVHLPSIHILLMISRSYLGPHLHWTPEWHVYETLHQNNIPSLLHLTFTTSSSVVSLWSSNLEARDIKDQIEKKQEKTFEFFQNKSNQPSEGKFIVFVCVCDHGGNVEC